MVALVRVQPRIDRKRRRSFILLSTAAAVVSLGVIEGSAAQPATATSAAIRPTAAVDIAAQFGPAFARVGNREFHPQVLAVLADASSKRFLRVIYPAGSSARSCSNCRSIGGAQAVVALAAGPRTEATLSYFVRFPVGFQWQRGGKLPGLCGGTCNSGGVDPNGFNGWSARFMWRPGGVAEVYAYLATTRGYGTRLATGAWHWKADGGWHLVTEHIRLNTPGRFNGVIDVTYGGRLVAHIGGLLFRTTPNLRIDSLFFSTFYGGHDITWAPTRTMHIDFTRFSIR